MLKIVTYLFLTGACWLKAQSVSCNSPARTKTITCTAIGGAHYRNWNFYGDDSHGVSRGASIDAPTWSGEVVQSGHISVDLYSASGGVTTVFAPVTVLVRPLSSFMLKAVNPDNEQPGYTCTSRQGTTLTLSLPSPPTASLTERESSVNIARYQISRIHLVKSLTMVRMKGMHSSRQRPHIPNTTGFTATI